MVAARGVPARNPVRTTLYILIAGTLAASPAAVGAQQRLERFEPPMERTVPTISIADPAAERPALLLGAGGVAGGALLGGVGALAGYAIGCGAGSLSTGMPEEDYCGVLAFPGFVAGELIGIPLGVWLADGRRGSYGAGFVASLGALVVGSGAALLAGESGAWIVIPLIPVGQVVAAVAVERATADDD